VLLSGGALLALMPLAYPAWGVAIRATKSAGLDVTVTDNIDLEPDDEASAALIFSPFVGAQVRGDGARVNFAFDYRLTLDTIFSEGTDFNLRNEGIGFGRAELVEDMLFVDVTGSVSQPIIDPQGRTGSNPSVGRQNRSDVVGGSFSPYLLNRFGGVAESELRYRYAYTYVGDEQVGDTQTNEVLARLSTGPDFSRLRLDGIAEYSNTTSDDPTGDLERSTLRLDAQYGLVRQFFLLGSIGYEKIDTQSLNDDPDGPIWYVGFLTQPGPRTELRLTWGRRYDEPDINGSLTYRITPRLIFQASYRHVLETTQQQFSIFQLQQNEFGELVDPITNLPVDITDPRFGLRTEPYRANRFRASLTGNYERNTVTLAGSTEEREYDVRDNERYVSAQLGWTRQLAPETDLFAGVGWRRVDSGNTPSSVLAGLSEPIEGDTDTITARIALTHAISKDVYGSVSLGRAQRYADDPSDEYTENSLTLGVRIVF
jgi:uncharacterized protein (PEP-CTERM system associated)